MSYYHILIEVDDYISTIEQTRDIEILDIQDLSPYLHSILIPYFNEHELEFEDENLAYNEVLHLEVKQTPYNRNKGQSKSRTPDPPKSARLSSPKKPPIS